MNHLFGLALLSLVVLCALSGRADTPALAPLPRLKHPIAVIAHRAGRALAPENTLAAIRNAIKLGVDYVELDVRATRDGVLVLMHDRSVDRTTDGKGNIADLDFATLRGFDAGSRFGPEFKGEKIPTFDEALALCRNHVHIYVDHKEGPVEKLLAAIRKARMEKQVIIYNGVETLREWKRLAPHLPVMPSLPDEYKHTGGIADFQKVLSVEVLDGNVTVWRKEWIEEAHRVGQKVYVDNLGLWDNPDGFRKAIAMGVDGIQTDHPDQLLTVLKEKSP